jgi:hypothetical protein
MSAIEVSSPAVASVEEQMNLETETTAPTPSVEENNNNMNASDSEAHPAAPSGEEGNTNNVDEGEVQKINHFALLIPKPSDPRVEIYNSFNYHGKLWILNTIVSVCSQLFNIITFIMLMAFAAYFKYAGTRLGGVCP